ncbi:hypothetical protein DFJ77DRAFT_76111 [Powellomyces hirtus]|nr:hypothetical protein DFJ77DRAFT_76111 [Powellomyces hirtus]
MPPKKINKKQRALEKENAAKAEADASKAIAENVQDWKARFAKKPKDTKTLHGLFTKPSVRASLVETSIISDSEEVLAAAQLLSNKLDELLVVEDVTGSHTNADDDCSVFCLFASTAPQHVSMDPLKDYNDAREEMIRRRECEVESDIEEERSSQFKSIVVNADQVRQGSAIRLDAWQERVIDLTTLASPPTHKSLRKRKSQKRRRVDTAIKAGTLKRKMPIAF